MYNIKIKLAAVSLTQIIRIVLYLYRIVRINKSGHYRRRADEQQTDRTRFDVVHSVGAGRCN